MIDEQLSKLLDSYTIRVLNSDDRVLFAEAIAAAKASAIRAAHFALWLSCIESLKRKFRELAARDSSAGRILGEIALLDEEKRYIDSYVLEQARAFGLISAIELAKLVHIHAMDAIYRCPYEKKPTIEEFIADASVVVDSVLCRPTRLQASSISEKAHLLTQEVQSLSRALEKHLKEQKQVAPPQQPSLQKSAVPGKSNPTGQTTTSSQLVSQKPLQQKQLKVSKETEADPTRKPELQTTPPQAKSEPPKEVESK